jgi:ferric-dicitrate binding protein FerR (iron transport regulator)
MKNKIPPELIHKYLQGQCSQQEEAIINTWYESFDGDTDPLTSLTAEEQQVVKQLMHSRIKARIRAVPVVRKNRVMVYAAIAASLLLFIGIRFWMKTPMKSTPLVAYRNASHGLMKQVLPDSSIVWLHPKARLSYAVGETRDVHLEGDAFFEIAKDPAHPFIVYSGIIVTRVLGTSFYINGNEVSVVSGKVAVHAAAEEEIILLPKQRVTLSDKALVKEKGEAPGIWQQHNVSFDNVPVKQVVDTLNKVFNTHIRLEDKKMGTYLFKADFTGQNLAAILEIMEQSLEVTYEITNNEIILKYQH